MRRPVFFALLVMPLAACLGEREEDPAADAAAAADVAGDVLQEETPDAAVFPLLTIGAECVASAECETGHCAQPCSGYGRCAPNGCEADEDCDVPGSEQAHCCTDGACSPATGAACGDRSGTHGSPCANGPTDCAADLECVDRCLAGAFCAAACTDDASCAELDPESACYRTPSGSQRCVPDPDLSIACERRSDCPAGALCVPYISFDGTHVIKTCFGNAGARRTGTQCSDRRQCQSGFCIEGLCTEGCLEDEDCACGEEMGCTEQSCQEVVFQTGPDQSSAVLMCSAAQG